MEAKTRWRVVMASFSFSMRFRSSARSRSTCCGEGVLGWWVRQAGSAQTLTTCPRLPPSMTMASVILSQGFWTAEGLLLAPFGLGFLISNSTYRFRPRGAPSREFHAAEIWISCGLVSRVSFTEASILARKQSGEVHESLRTSGKRSLLNPVRFGQLAHEPASGTSISSCLSNGADASCSKMFDSIHAANSRTGIKTWLFPSLVHKPRKEAENASCC